MRSATIEREVTSKVEVPAPIRMAAPYTITVAVVVVGASATQNQILLSHKRIIIVLK